MLKLVVLQVKEHYGDVPVYVMANGVQEDPSHFKDSLRVYYLYNYINEALKGKNSLPTNRKTPIPESSLFALTVFILSTHPGWRQPEGLLRLRPERPKRPKVRLVRPSPRGSHRQSLTLQLSQPHPAQRLPRSGRRSSAVSRRSSGLPGVPRPGQGAHGGLPDPGGLGGADHSGPHYLLHVQKTQGVILTGSTMTQMSH